MENSHKKSCDAMLSKYLTAVKKRVIQQVMKMGHKGHEEAQRSQRSQI